MMDRIEQLEYDLAMLREHGSGCSCQLYPEGSGVR